MKQMKFWTTILILGITAGLTIMLSRAPEMVQCQDIRAFPQIIAEWSGKDIPLEESVYEILETRNVLCREYSINPQSSTEKTPVYLTIIYSENNRKVSHPPEVCYSGSGTEIMDKSEITINTSSENIKATKFIAKKNRKKEMVLYWYLAGNEFTTDYIKQQLKIAFKQAQNKKAGGALIKISAPVVESEEKTLAELKRFAYQAAPLIKRFLGDQ